jgi:branched-chain amino acid aminotransferase/4-amino-4-deoxychorismate lyase
VTPVWLDGRLIDAAEARIDPSDRGFTLGDGLFETLRARAGRILWFDDHLARLREGAAILGIPVPLDAARIGEGLNALLAAAGFDDAALRLTLTRGPSATRGLWPPGEPVRPTLLATVAARVVLPRPRLIVAAETRRNEGSPLSRVKVLGYADNLLARREAIARAADDAILLNNRDRVTCATVGNLFLRLDGAWVTPPLADGVLPGLARARLIPRLGAREESIPVGALDRVEAVLLTNSLGAIAALALDGRVLPEPGVDLAPLYD